MWFAQDCTLGDLSVHVGDSSWHSGEIVKSRIAPFNVIIILLLLLLIQQSINKSVNTYQAERGYATKVLVGEDDGSFHHWLHVFLYHTGVGHLIHTR